MKRLVNPLLTLNRLQFLPCLTSKGLGVFKDSMSEIKLTSLVTVIKCLFVWVGISVLCPKYARQKKSVWVWPLPFHKQAAL